MFVSMDKGWLKAQLAAGRSYEDLGREVGRHASTVSYWARRHGLTSTRVSLHAARGGIDRDLLAQLVEDGLSVRRIAERLERSSATVRHWLSEYGLQTQRARLRSPVEPSRAGVAVRDCPRHGRTKFVRRGDEKGWRCLRCRSEAVTRRRQKVKDILVREAGGRCARCGYDRHVGALEFHHLDPVDKRFSLSQMGVARALDRAREEAGKCVLLCANCHAEVEAGMARVPFALNGAHQGPTSWVAHQVVHDPG
jgi:Homeodomain-like domain